MFSKYIHDVFHLWSWNYVIFSIIRYTDVMLFYYMTKQKTPKNCFEILMIWYELYSNYDKQCMRFWIYTYDMMFQIHSSIYDYFICLYRQRWFLTMTNWRKFNEMTNREFHFLKRYMFSIIDITVSHRQTI
jgi:hypothetical protein